ncbi:amino acid/polyamine/organocation transporter (APC superfamily) [Algoriphagus boseongensis]|uniref:Amino acid/polyamine/organocation transporter (APC superfamily) n=1 Tax=Algoriphagus boseongensis TaxID=1442587 RepID=A0A4R6TB40_9BACT|nr:amino acid permease [Algoriphagus boseongensis]TDQ19202.1 amino acid/polyamine/organocation transporter (APC superfamily) [Algoriphagus boseongensis]
MKSLSKISWKTAAGLVIANMIGTGVFTSLGFQLAEVQNTWSILLLWILGGIMALIGAFVYAELGTHFRKTGGDYIFLSETIHPAIGYSYAWVSLTVGFSAPIAIAAMAMNNYLTPMLGETILPGLFFLLVIPLFHTISIGKSAIFQDLFTLVKVLFMLVLIGLGFFFSSRVSPDSFDFSSSWKNEVILPGFAVSLIYVFYAYTGWNSAAYIIEEVDQPQKNLPKALIASTLLVMVVYVLLQVILLKHAQVDQLTGKVQVADIAFGNLFGNSGALWVSFFIALQLIATISGYSWVGPRITYAMARDFRLWSPLAKVNSHGIPVRAILLNTLFSLALFLSGSFEQVMVYAGFVLQLMGTITVFSSLKIKKETGFITPFKPIPQYLYLIFSTSVLIYLFWDKPWESISGLGIVGVGFLIFLFDKKVS